MDEYHFKALKHRSQEIPVKGLHPSRDTLKVLQSDLEVKSKFSATLQNKSCGTSSKFLVIQGIVDSPLLKSKSRLFKQWMSRIDLEETKQWTKKPADTTKALLTHEYSEASQVIEYFRGKNTKDSEDRSQARDGSWTTLVAQKLRLVSYHLQRPLKEEWLDKESNRRSLRRYLMESSSHGIDLWSCNLNRSTQMSRKKRLRWLEQAWIWGYQTNPCV